jgi:hypothetical protein
MVAKVGAAASCIQPAALATGFAHLSSLRFIGSSAIGHVPCRSASLVGGAGAAWVMISAVRLNHATRTVFVVGPHPVGHGVVGSILVPAPRRDVEKAVDANELLIATGEGRVGVEDLPRLALVENAVAGEVLQTHRPGFHWLVVIAGGPCSDALRRKRHAEIVVEVTIEGRDPRNLSSHALAHDFDLLDGGSRYNGITHIMIFEMDQNTIDMVDGERAADVLVNCSRTHHEMLDDKLAAPVEEVAKRHLACQRVEDVRLLHADPGQGALLLAQLVARLRQRLFLGEHGSACTQPFLARYDAMLFHVTSFLQAVRGALPICRCC